MAEPSRYLVSFEDVHATCGGVDISAITELKVSTMTNGVPLIMLSVDGGNSDMSGSVAAEGVSLDNARIIFDACRSMVKTDGATLSLSLTCRAVGPGGSETQTLSINGWMLIDVALSSVQRKGVCTASLTFAHPLYKAHLGGAMVGLLETPPLVSQVNGGNPLDVFVNALTTYASTARAKPEPITLPGAYGPAEVHPILQSHLMKALSALRASVTWEGGGLPAEKILAGWGPALCAGIATSYAVPSAGNSVLHTLFSGLIPECSLALGGDYMAGSLTLKPFEPWADASVELSDSRVMSVDFPSNDPSPISGVKFMVAATSGGGFISWHYDGAQGGGSRPFEAFYVPKSELDAPYMYGPIQQFTEPAWLQQMAGHFDNLMSYKKSDAETTGSGLWHSATTVPRNGSVPTGGGGSKVSSTVYAEAALMCAKAYFETSLMKDWGFSVSAHLSITVGGSTLCPGKVLKVTTPSGEVVSGYITQVEHVISVASRAASTRVVCTHPRFGKLPAAITSPKNALYS